MIVSCGEALIDFLPIPKGDGTVTYQAVPGGSPFNVAIAASRMGSSSAFFGGLSRDMFGETLMSVLRENKVDTSLVCVSDRTTTLAFVSLVGGNARYAFFDEGSAGRMLVEAPPLPESVVALHFGSFSLAQEPCGSALEGLMKREQGNRVISLDVNVRPTLIGDREKYLARINRLVAMSDLVKLSEEDLAWLHPESTFVDIAQTWLSLGTKLVVLTKGSAGAEAISKHAFVSIPGVVIDVADTIGAGDTFTAAMLANLEKGGALGKEKLAHLSDSAIGDSLRFARKAASITVSRPGADPPWLHEIM